MDLLISVLGWVGSLEVIAAYGLNSLQKIKSDSVAFQVLNLTGSVFLIINSVCKEAYPFTFINTVWSIIAIVALYKIISKKKSS